MDINYIFFKDSLQSLVSEYNGKYIVIKDQRVIASYDNFDEAYTETMKKEKLGSFIIQHCTPDALMPSAKFAWNNVVFSSVSV